MNLRVEVAGKTDVGRVRANNEDSLGYDRRHGIFVVCDGMGGAAAGEVASKIGVDSVVAFYGTSVGSTTPRQVGPALEHLTPRANLLASAIRIANQKIFEASQRNPSQAGMGSTIVAVAVESNFYSIGHVGDSRIYLIRNGAIQQLTADHSLVMEQVRRGIISLEDAKRVDYQNIVVRALGAESTVEPDVDDMMAMENDILLLCSDGLTQHVEDRKLLEIITSESGLERAVNKLIETAKSGGGTDNITAILLRFNKAGFWDSLLHKA